MLKQYALKNKMRVLLVESHRAPVVSVQVWVKTGSADEKKGQEGISHFIEHLVFKGTDKYGVGEIARTVEGSGGELNAYTSFDYTVFHVTIASEFVDVGLDTVSQMMGFPKFDPKEIDNERGVVIEEIKRGTDSPGRVASQLIFSTVFKKHPYGIPVIGYDKIIKTVSPKTLLQYYHARYVPSNMTLVVAGRLEKDIRAKVQNYFGEFQSYPLKKVKRNPEPAQKTPRFSYSTTEFKEAQLNIAFTVPSVKHPDVPALDILAMVLGQGDSSRLMKGLRLQKPLVTGVSSGAFNPLDLGLFITNLSFQPERFGEIKAVLDEQFARLVTEPVSKEEIERAIVKIESDEVFSLETVDGLARKVGVFQTLLNDPEFINAYLKAIHKLTPEGLLKIARKYLTPDRLSMGLMLHKQDAQKLPKPDFEKWGKAFGKKLLEKKTDAVVDKKGSSIKLKSPKINLSAAQNQEVESKVLSSGARVLFKQNKGVPAFAMKVGFLAGSRVESENLSGLTTLLSNTWTSGTAVRTEDQIAGEIESCGGQLSAFGGRNSVGLSLEVINAFEDRALSLFSDVLAGPEFNQEALSRELHIQRAGIKSKIDYPSSMAVQLFSEEIFKGHPYSRDPLGSLNTLDNLTRQEVKNHFKQHVTAPNAVFSVVGDFDKQKVIDALEAATARLPRSKVPARNFKLTELGSSIVKFQQIQKNQTHLLHGYRGLTLKDPDRYVLQVIQSVLSGQGGRLFLELRDKNSLAYSVSPIELEGLDAGYFGTYIGCSPEKAKRALEMMSFELDKLVSEEVSRDEVERAKRFLIGRHSIDLQRNGAQSSFILFDELYGIDSRESLNFAEKLKPITSADVQRVARRIFQESGPSVSVAVGALSPWQAESQARGVGTPQAQSV